jgi:hypothetical protein
MRRAVRTGRRERRLSKLTKGKGMTRQKLSEKKKKKN